MPSCWFVIHFDNESQIIFLVVPLHSKCFIMRQNPKIQVLVFQSIFSIFIWNLLQYFYMILENFVILQFFQGIFPGPPHALLHWEGKIFKKGQDLT